MRYIYIFLYSDVRIRLHIEGDLSRGFLPSAASLEARQLLRHAFR